MLVYECTIGRQTLEQLSPTLGPSWTLSIQRFGWRITGQLHIRSGVTPCLFLITGIAVNVKHASIDYAPDASWTTTVIDARILDAGWTNMVADFEHSLHGAPLFDCTLGRYRMWKT